MGALPASGMTLLSISFNIHNDEVIARSVLKIGARAPGRFGLVKYSYKSGVDYSDVRTISDPPRSTSIAQTPPAFMGARRQCPAGSYIRIIPRLAQFLR
jgi:hypothetical protein